MAKVQGSASAILRDGAAVFLYNSKDGDIVERVYDRMRELSISVWMDTKDIVPGERWRGRVGEAVGVSRAVVAFVGSYGLTDNQKQELDAAQEEQLRIIPVLLPGVAKLPENNVGLNGRRCIRITEDLDDKGIYELHWAILGRKPKRPKRIAQFRVPVQLEEWDCFVAISRYVLDEVRSGQDPFLRCVEDAAQQADVKLTQPWDGTADGFSPYVPEAIKSAELIIADCRVDKQTKRPYPDVMYQVGQATALGKPMVIVIGGDKDFEPIIVARDILQLSSDNVDAFTEQLTEIMRAAKSESENVPTLVDHRLSQVHMVFSDVLALLKSELWKHLQTIISFGLNVSHAFRDISEQMHRLDLELADLETLFVDPPAFQKLAGGNGDDAVSRTWMKTRSIFGESFLPVHHKNFVLEMVDFPQRHGIVSEAYRTLIEELEDDKAECDLLQNSKKFFEHVVSRIDTYEKLHERTLAEFGVAKESEISRESEGTHVPRFTLFESEAAEEINEARTLMLRSAVSAQKSRADIIHEEAKAMITVFLELVGQHHNKES